MPADNSCHHWFLRVCNKRNAFCSWRNKATTVFGDFRRCVTRQLLLKSLIKVIRCLSAANFSCYIDKKQRVCYNKIEVITMSNSVGEYIRNRRESKGMSLKKLGEACGVSDSEILKIGSRMKRLPHCHHR